MKQVPEKKVTGREEQYKWLIDKLAGHAAFNRLRGKLGQETSRLAHLNQLIDTAESPTAFCSAWDEYAADMRVVGNLLAQLVRDGWDDAAVELRYSLEYADYLLDGETVRLDETVPVTALIIDFPKSCAMISWIRAGHWMDLNEYLRGARNMPLAVKMFAEFPSLEKFTAQRHQSGGYEGWDLLAAYRHDVLFRFTREAFGRLEHDLETVPFMAKAQPMEIAYGTFNDHLEVTHAHNHDESALGYLFLADQAEVLSQIPREHQHCVSTWNFRLPRILTENASEKWTNRLLVGFHPEERHNDWTHSPGAFPSNGCNHGYGAVLLHTKQHNYEKYLSRYNELAGHGGAILQKDDEPVAFVLNPF